MKGHKMNSQSLYELGDVCVCVERAHCCVVPLLGHTHHNSNVPVHDSSDASRLRETRFVGLVVWSCGVKGGGFESI